MDVDMSGVDIDAEFDMDSTAAFQSSLTIGKRLRDDDDQSISVSRTSSPSRTDSVNGSARKQRKKLVIPPSSRSRRNATPSASNSATPALNTPGTATAAAATSAVSVPGTATANQSYLANPGQSVGGQGFAAIQPSAALGIFDPPMDVSLPSALRTHDGTEANGNGASEEGDDVGFEIPPLSVAEETSSLRDDGPRTGGSTTTTGPTILINTGRRGPNRNATVPKPVLKLTAGGAKKGKFKANDGEIPNQDFCSSCRGIGRFLCCDGCPRSFHFMCLDPPLAVDELPREDVWYCKVCRAERDTKPKRLPTSLFAEICAKVDEENPTQFRLPPEIRNFFAGVATTQNGTYHDSEETRTKTDRRGFVEERDPTRLKDGRSRAVACYACGGSAMPGNKPLTEPGATWRSIVSCDYCSLHWHLDCLQPALTSMPPAGKKWMCPNHAEQVMPKRRTVKHNLQMVDVKDRGRHNNGNIVVVPEDDAPRDKLDVDEIVINSRKYRVPEKTIRLDFWSKLGHGRRKNGPIKAPAKAGSESPLTQLSDSRSVSPEPTPDPTLDDLSAANLVLSFYNSIAHKLPQAVEENAEMTPASEV